jgi:hypothetical protein
MKFAEVRGFPPEVEDRIGMTMPDFDSALRSIEAIWKREAELRHWRGIESRWRSQDKCGAASVMARRIVGAVRDPEDGYLGFWDIRPGFQDHPFIFGATEPVEFHYFKSDPIRSNPISIESLTPVARHVGRRCRLSYEMRHQRCLLDSRLRLNDNPVRAVAWTYGGSIKTLLSQEGFIPSRRLLCSEAKWCDDCGVETHMAGGPKEATLGVSGSGIGSRSWVPLLCRECFDENRRPIYSPSEKGTERCTTSASI